MRPIGDNIYGPILTRVFREAEDQEEIDGGVLLRGVIAFQNSLMRLSAQSIQEWLSDAERLS